MKDLHAANSSIIAEAVRKATRSNPRKRRGPRPGMIRVQKADWPSFDRQNAESGLEAEENPRSIWRPARLVCKCGTAALNVQGRLHQADSPRRQVHNRQWPRSLDEVGSPLDGYISDGENERSSVWRKLWIAINLTSGLVTRNPPISAGRDLAKRRVAQVQ